MSESGTLAFTHFWHCHDGHPRSSYSSWCGDRCPPWFSSTFAGACIPGLSWYVDLPFPAYCWRSHRPLASSFGPANDRRRTKAKICLCRRYACYTLTAPALKMARGLCGSCIRIEIDMCVRILRLLNYRQTGLRLPLLPAYFLCVGRARATDCTRDVMNPDRAAGRPGRTGGVY